MQLFEMQGLLAGKCLPGNMFVGESLAEYFLRQFNQRDELARQVSALQLSHDDIINSLGIKGDGPVSKLVIEYVMGLVAENVALQARTPFAYSYRYAGCETCEGFQDWRWELSRERPPEWMLETGKVTNLVELFECHETPATDAFTAELRAQGIEDWISSRDGRWNGTTKEAEEFAANLRAGRKG